MCPEKRLEKYCACHGLELIRARDMVTVTNVPYVTQSGEIGRCEITVEKDERTGKSIGVSGVAKHCAKVRLLTPDDRNGKIYEADGKEMGARVGVDGKDFCTLSIKNKAKDSETAEETIYRYTKRIVGASIAKSKDKGEWIEQNEIFKIPNTFEGRAGVREMQDKVRTQKVAIFGVGGTGSHILDLMSKTPVAEIHLIDNDVVNWHNLMRGPGGPTKEDIKEIQGGILQKREYHKRKYEELRHGIVVHEFRGSKETIEELVQAGVSVAFTSVDQQDGKRQDELYETLQKNGIIFIDCGISLKNEDNQIDGSVQVFSSAEAPERWSNAIPNATVNGRKSMYQNTQVAEINALAAALAVVEWRKVTGQFVKNSEGSESYAILKYKIGRSKVIKG